MSKVDEVLDTISAMTVLELSELLKDFEERFGVTAAAPVAAMPMAVPAAAEAAEEEEEQTAFDVVLSEVGDKKIQVIKEVRSLTSLGLKEAKELVDTAPQPVLQGVPREEADGAAAALEAAGAVIKIS
ncbi:MAG: 50S ribosomal protein L7/L12 [bacterium]|nr:50S ribosomal protein L7/L12 [bacterium]